ncbi:hypothetical protein D3C78_1292920 [compost metagenome]
MRGRLGALHAGRGKRILLLARELVLGCAVFAKRAHGTAGLVSVLQAVEHHVVENLVVAHAVAAAALLQQVRRIGHAFHAARDHHIAAAGHQLVMGQQRGLHARAAHLGQGHGTGALRQSALEPGLARGRLALTGHQAVAEQHFIHLLGGDACALDCGPDGGTAQIMGRELGKIALEGAHGGTGSAHDHNGFSHFCLLG